MAPAFRKVALAALFAVAHSDGTCGRDGVCDEELSLMQDLIKRGASRQKLAVSEVDLKSKEGRQDSMTKLLETATHMVKTGATPDVLWFVSNITLEIEHDVKDQVIDAHETDQNFINVLLARYQEAVENLNQGNEHVSGLADSRHASIDDLKKCRATESADCSRARRCQEELEEAWRNVEHQESIMRRHHSRIHDEWCVHPPNALELDDDPFNWPDISPYPLLVIPGETAEFRSFTVTEFEAYIIQKPIVEQAWQVYEAKVIECAALDVDLEIQVSTCDEEQVGVEEAVCEHATQARQVRRTFGDTWRDIGNGYQIAVEQITRLEYDRKREWETLTIIQCLLATISEHVTHAIETGEDCPTETSHPEETNREITDCHVITESLTEHLTIDYGTPPPMPELPDVHYYACTAEYVYEEQGSWPAELQAQHAGNMVGYESTLTGLSAMGWGGCAAPKTCSPCGGMEPLPPNPDNHEDAHECKVHETLMPGESDSESFRCLDGNCIGLGGRCNGHANCADGSDEFCPAADASPPFGCPAEGVNPYTTFACADGSGCIALGSRCNGHNNCADSSDELNCQCTPLTGVSVEATSGRLATVETFSSAVTSVFHDRDYVISSAGAFQGKTFIKFNAADKSTPGDHVMLKVNVPDAVKAYVAIFDGSAPSWLQSGHWTQTSMPGVTFSGAGVEFGQTAVENYGPGTVYEKNFPAGTISMPGGGHHDGPYLLFLEKPCTQMD